jgi:peptidoglycan/LPS O-acetylase OafA/YrhL
MSMPQAVGLLRRGERVPEFDGIRGIAILPILFLHLHALSIEPSLSSLSRRSASNPLRLATDACLLAVAAAISWHWFEQTVLRLGGTIPYESVAVASLLAGGLA